MEHTGTRETSADMVASPTGWDKTVLLSARFRVARVLLYIPHCCAAAAVFTYETATGLLNRWELNEANILILVQNVQGTKSQHRMTLLTDCDYEDIDARENRNGTDAPNGDLDIEQQSRHCKGTPAYSHSSHIQFLRPPNERCTYRFLSGVSYLTKVTPPWLHLVGTFYL